MSIAVLSSRNLEYNVSWRNVAPPLENALAELPNATLVAPPGLGRPSLRSAMPAWLSAIKTVRRADAVFWIQLDLHPDGRLWALAYLRPLAPRFVYVLDAFQSIVGDLGRLLSAQRVTVAFCAYREAVTSLRTRFPALVTEWMPLGFPPEVFHDLRVERDIYAFWMGRRSPGLHTALTEHCAARGLVYRFSRFPGDPHTTQELNQLVSRARYFVVTPPDLDNRVRTGGFSPLTSRYIEGMAAGSRLLGVRPASGEFEALFPGTALVECSPDGHDLAAVLAEADADPLAEETRLRARDIVHAFHTWECRARAFHERIRSVD